MRQVLEGLLVETERWEEAFQLLRGSQQATQRVMEAYAAWLVAQGRGTDAYKVLRYHASNSCLCGKGYHPAARLQSPIKSDHTCSTNPVSN